MHAQEKMSFAGEQDDFFLDLIMEMYHSSWRGEHDWIFVTDVMLLELLEHTVGCVQSRPYYSGLRTHLALNRQRRLPKAALQASHCHNACYMHINLRHSERYGDLIASLHGISTDVHTNTSCEIA